MTKEQLEQLKHLFSLQKEGIITKEELNKEKEKIFNMPPTSPKVNQNKENEKKLKKPATPPSTKANPKLDPLAKSRIVAGVLGVLLGGLGIHRFYLGFTGIGIIQIIVTVCTSGVGAIWGFIEGILILVGNTITTDSTGRALKD